VLPAARGRTAKHPEEAARSRSRCSRRPGRVSLNLQQWKETIELVHTPATGGRPVGWMAKEDWENLLALQRTYGGIQTRPVAEYYTNEFFNCR
jgi:hypothetical protein